MSTAITIALIICVTILLVAVLALIGLFRLIKRAETKWDQVLEEQKRLRQRE